MIYTPPLLIIDLIVTFDIKKVDVEGAIKTF